MTLVEEFNALIAKTEKLVPFIDRVQAQPYGLSYLFDGKLDCVVINVVPGVFIDMQEVILHNFVAPDQIEHYDEIEHMTYKTMEAMVQDWIDMLYS